MSLTLSNQQSHKKEIDMNTTKPEESIETNLKFIDFNNFEELSQHPEILDSLLYNYCKIFHLGNSTIKVENCNHNRIRSTLSITYCTVRVCAVIHLLVVLAKVTDYLHPLRSEIGAFSF